MFQIEHLQTTSYTNTYTINTIPLPSSIKRIANIHSPKITQHPRLTLLISIQKFTLNITNSPLSRQKFINIIKYKNIRKLHDDISEEDIKRPHVISHSLKKWNIYTEYLYCYDDMELLTVRQFYILNRLRSFHCHLNYDLHQLFHYKLYKQAFLRKDYDFKFECKSMNEKCIKIHHGKCNNCTDDAYESLYHFMMECKKYDHQRNLLRYIVSPIINKYNEPYSLKSLLFSTLFCSTQHRKLIYGICPWYPTIWMVVISFIININFFLF